MPMITEAKPVVFDDSLPERVDVVVIGAGVVGTATAYFLAQARCAGAALRERPRGGRAVEPQLGLDSPAGPRPGRAARS